MRHDELREKRDDLLKQRARSTMGGQRDELREVEKELRTLRRQYGARRKERPDQELWESWRRRRLAEVHRLVRLLSGSGVGAKHRKLYAPVRCRSSPQE